MSRHIHHSVTIGRFAIVFFAIVLGFASVVGMIWHIQHSQSEEDKWSKIEGKQVKTDVPITPNRGNILDANGNILASSMTEYVVYMDTRVEALHQGGDTLFKHYIDTISNGLSRIIGDKSPRAYKDLITKAFQSTSQDVSIRDIRLHNGSISYLQKKQIQLLPLIKRGEIKSGIHFEEQHIRKKPFGRLAGRTIGTIFKQTGEGKSGLEMRFNSTLHGIDGIANRMRVAGNMTDVPIMEAKDGDDVVTTLDVNLMDICETALESKLKQWEADWGCVILMETHSGQIKAMINLDRQEDGSYDEVLNHAVTRVEPGSTFKTITLMAALDDGRIQMSDTFHVSSRGWYYLSKDCDHTDSHICKPIYTVREALAASSNISFAKLIVRAYKGKAEDFVEKLNRMGLTREFYSEIPGSSAPNIVVPDDKVTISKMAYGYTVELSPLQLVAFYNGIANNGKMIRPYMVSRIEHNGHTIQHFDTEVLNAHMCNDQTLKNVKDALHDVVWDNDLGTASVRKNEFGKVIGKKAQSDLVHIAGKTGTAQIRQSGYSEHEHRITFVGYFPEEDPQYTCICMIERPHHPYYDSGFDCGYVVRKIAELTMASEWVYEIKNGEKIFRKR